MSLSVIYFGMGGLLSVTPLISLIEAGIIVEAIFIPRNSKDKNPPIKLPTIKPIKNEFRLNSSLGKLIYQIAGESEIPIYSIGNFNKSVINLVSSFSPNVLITSCFRWKIPLDLLQSISMGGINVHPSSLPGFKGPYPIFWQLKLGVDIGVSIHKMSDVFDDGEVISQAKVSFDTGTRSSELDSKIGMVGGELLVNYLLKGKLNVLEDRSEPSYQSIPKWEDKYISIKGSGQQAFRFIRGASDFLPFWTIDAKGKEIIINQAIEFRKWDVSQPELDLASNQKTLKFSDGELIIS